jgi:hypothetical protein
MKCNHIVGIEHPRFQPERPITHSEHMKRKDGWRGEVNFICPLCGKEIWIWKTINDPRLGRVTVKKYIG